MKYKKKCFVGEPFASFNELLEWLDSGFWVFASSKPQHPYWILNRPLISVRRDQQKGAIRACYNESGEPYITKRLMILDDETKGLFIEPVNFYAEDDSYGIVGWSFDCPYCGYENRFVMDESNPDHECRECGRSIKLVPITYTMTAE